MTRRTLGWPGDDPRLPVIMWRCPGGYAYRIGSAYCVVRSWRDLWGSLWWQVSHRVRHWAGMHP